MDKILYFIIMWVTAILFIIIGIYAINRKKPMWLWTGSQIPESKIKDVKAYNRAVGKMWLIFSILFFIGGIIDFFSPLFSIILFAFTCIVGIGGIVWCYHKIEEKYYIK